MAPPRRSTKLPTRQRSAELADAGIFLRYRLQHFTIAHLKCRLLISGGWLRSTLARQRGSICNCLPVSRPSPLFTLIRDIFAVSRLLEGIFEMNACLACRRIKIRCRVSGDSAVCERCSRKSLECVFQKHRRGRKPGTR
jgi:hypothetical protein